MQSKARTLRRWLTGAIVAAALAAPAAASAQVVVVANGSPITEFDIDQRGKLMASSSHTNPPRQQVINELIDDRLKILKAKTYGLEVNDAELDTAYNGLAQRQHVTPAQFNQMLEHSGILPATLKARMRAEMTWNQLVRGKFSSSLEVGESDVASALRARNDANDASVGYMYTLYPVTVVAARGSSKEVLESKLHEAENLRDRFLNCNEGLALARAMRDVAVRDPLHKSSADLPPALRDLLASIQVGRMTTPEVTPQGLQMYALCAKKQSSAESTVKRDVREEIFTKRFEAEAKKFLDEIRKQAMIEYK